MINDTTVPFLESALTSQAIYASGGSVIWRRCRYSFYHRYRRFQERLNTAMMRAFYTVPGVALITLHAGRAPFRRLSSRADDERHARCRDGRSGSQAEARAGARVPRAHSRLHRLINRPHDARPAAAFAIGHGGRFHFQLRRAAHRLSANTTLTPRRVFAAMTPRVGVASQCGVMGSTVTGSALSSLRCESGVSFSVDKCRCAGLSFQSRPRSPPPAASHFCS